MMTKRSLQVALCSFMAHPEVLADFKRVRLLG